MKKKFPSSKDIKKILASFAEELQGAETDYDYRSGLSNAVKTFMDFLDKTYHLGFDDGYDEGYDDGSFGIEKHG